MNHHTNFFLFSHLFFSSSAKMVKTKELTDFEHGKVIGFHEAEDSKRDISNKTGYGKTTIHNIITKYCETGAISVTSQSGCPKKITEQNKHHLKTIFVKN